MNISFFVLAAQGNLLQDLEWPESHPLGGSETSVLRLAHALQKRGQSIQILTDLEQLKNHKCDIFVSLRNWQIFNNGFFPGKRNYLWCHDDADQPIVKPLEDPQLAKSIYERLDGVFLLSHYQTQRWITNLNLPVKKSILTSNGVPLERFDPHPEKLAERKPWAYYSSTPFRGLEVLLLAWPYIQRVVPDAQLHICSSMKIYNPDSKEERFLALYEKAGELPGVQYHGSVGQAELRNIAQQCRVLAYPCIFPETSCIAAMEAMAAGCVVVSSTLGALPETAWQNPLFAISDGWLDLWIMEIIKLFKDNRYYEQRAFHNLAIANVFDWNLVAGKWIDIFRN